MKPMAVTFLIGYSLQNCHWLFQSLPSQPDIVKMVPVTSKFNTESSFLFIFSCIKKRNFICNELCYVGLYCCFFNITFTAQIFHDTTRYWVQSCELLRIWNTLILGNTSIYHPTPTEGVRALICSSHFVNWPTSCNINNTPMKTEPYLKAN